MWKDKLGNALIDIAKYFITGVLVTSLVKDLEGVRWLRLPDRHGGSGHPFRDRNKIHKRQ